MLALDMAIQRYRRRIVISAASDLNNLLDFAAAAALAWPAVNPL